MNRKQVAKNIARILRENPQKIRQLDAVQAITVHHTSDDHLIIKAELYHNHIVRYLITGTRCGMTVTANTLTNKLTRKARLEQPWYEGETDMYAGEILQLI